MIKILETVKTKDNRYKYKVICTECGYRFQVRVNRYNENGKCKGCLTSERNRGLRGDHKGVGVISRTFFNYFKNGAKRRKVDFKVSIDYLNSIWTGKCAITGFDIVAPQSVDKLSNHEKQYNTASLDRIDSSRPYEEGNVQWVHKHINVMKNGYPQDEFIYLCHTVASYNANQQPSVLKGNRKVSTKVQRLGSEDSQPITSPRVPDIHKRG